MIIRDYHKLTASNWVTNIGNGMHTIAMASLLYDKTGSAYSFGLVIALEFLSSIAIQFFVGNVIDNRNTKRVLVTCDIASGFIITAALLCVYLNAPLWLLIIILASMSLIKPFFRSGIFVATAEVTPEDKLIKVNSWSAMALQVGQIIGVAAAGPIIALYSTTAALAVNAVSFFLSGLVINTITTPLKKMTSSSKGVLAMLLSWREVLILMWRKRGSIWHIVLASGDLLMVSFFNVLLVPINHALNGSGFTLSLLDGSFAVGSILAAPWVERVVARLGTTHACTLGYVLQALGFAALAFTPSVFVAALFIAVLGIGNTIGVITFTARLQARLAPEVRGRVSALRYTFLSLIGAITVPIIGHLDASLGVQVALMSVLVVLTLFMLTLLVLSSKRMYGDSLLTTQVAPS